MPAQPRPTVVLVDAGSSQLWAGWAKQLRDNDWHSDDTTVIDILPELESTRAVFAMDASDGSFLGCVVWNQYDDLVYIGYYIVLKKMAGQGLGPRMWRRAFSRFPATTKNIGLRSVPEMTEKYRRQDFPVVASHLFNYELTVKEAREMCQKLEAPQGKTLIAVDRTTDEQWLALMDYDQEVTGRDREALLDPFFDHMMVNGVCMLDGEGRIIGYAAISPTGHFEKDKFKLGPVFASSIQDALAMIAPLVDACENITPDAKILVKTISGSVGERTFSALIDKEPYVEGSTLWQTAFENKMNMDSCYVPHNHGGHFDA